MVVEMEVVEVIKIANWLRSLADLLDPPPVWVWCLHYTDTDSPAELVETLNTLEQSGAVILQTDGWVTGYDGTNLSSVQHCTAILYKRRRTWP